MANGELSEYDWLKYKAKKRDDIPSEPHFQVLVFKTRTEWSPGWGKDDRGDSSSVPHVDVYVFKKREDLDIFVSIAARTTTPFVFYHVGSLGKATVKVEVDTQV